MNQRHAGERRTEGRQRATYSPEAESGWAGGGATADGGAGAGVPAAAGDRSCLPRACDSAGGGGRANRPTRARSAAAWASPSANRARRTRTTRGGGRGGEDASRPGCGEDGSTARLRMRAGGGEAADSDGVGDAVARFGGGFLFFFFFFKRVRGADTRNVFPTYLLDCGFIFIKVKGFSVKMPMTDDQKH